MNLFMLYTIHAIHHYKHLILSRVYQIRTIQILYTPFMERAFVLTYNVQNHKNIAPSLQRILEKLDHDYVFIALQENFSTPAFNSVMRMVKKEFVKYKTLKCNKMFGISSILIAKNELAVRTLNMGLGPAALPSKGFSALQIGDMVFINGHFIAHEENRKRRAEMVQAMLNCTCAYFSKARAIVVAGDMNFRVAKSSGREELLAHGDYDGLKRGDEMEGLLLKYANFYEKEFKFPPTFKYKRGSDEYDMRRFPSWCDRIIVASNYNVEVIDYVAHDVRLSDHRPVSADIGFDQSVVSDTILVECTGVSYLRVMVTMVYCFIYENVLFIVFCIVVATLMLLYYSRIKRLFSYFRR